MQKNFGHNFKRLFRCKKGYIIEYQIDHILEPWTKYTINFINNRLISNVDYLSKSRLSQSNIILLFPDSNTLIYVTYNIAISMSLISNILLQEDPYQYSSTKFQLKYYDTILNKVRIGPTFIIVDMPMNSIILNKKQIPEFIENTMENTVENTVNNIIYGEDINTNLNNNLNLNLNQLIHRR